MDLLWAIQKFTKCDGDCDACTAIVQGYVSRFLARRIRLNNPADFEDLVGDVMNALLSRRKELDFASVGAFSVYAEKIAISQLCARRRTVSVDDATCERIPAEEVSPVMEILRRTLYEFADELWLGIDPSLTREERNARLLSAQLRIVHGRPIDEIDAMIGISTKSVLRDRSVINHLCFHELYWNNVRLTGHLLFPEKPISESVIGDAFREAEFRIGSSPFSDWTWEEVRLIILRYRNGMLLSKLVQLSPGTPKASIERVLDRSRNRFPFRDIAINLSARTSFVKPSAISDRNLYLRLTFQYSFRDDLPHLQVFERVIPAAELAGVAYNPEIINMLLSGGRLPQELRSYIARRAYAS